LKKTSRRFIGDRARSCGAGSARFFELPSQDHAGQLMAWPMEM
jgi:hypothetical protein